KNKLLPNRLNLTFFLKYIVSTSYNGMVVDQILRTWDENPTVRSHLDPGVRSILDGANGDIFTAESNGIGIWMNGFQSRDWLKLIEFLRGADVDVNDPYNIDDFHWDQDWGGAKQSWIQKYESGMTARFYFFPLDSVGSSSFT